MKELIQKFFDDEGGLTTVEYAVAGALIAIAVIAAFDALGAKVAEKIAAITTGLDT